jgi:hypothetical protein
MIIRNGRNSIHQICLASIILVIATMSACEHNREGALGVSEKKYISFSVLETLKPFGQSAFHYDFGPVKLTGSDRLSHIYEITNKSNRTIELIRAVNVKSCCGDIRCPQIELHPGMNARIEVVLKKNKLGPIDHLAVVETDHPNAKEIQLVTTAEIYPESDMIEIDGSFLDVSLLKGQSIEREYKIRSFGTRKELPIDLSDLSFRTTLKARWRGDSELTELEHGVIMRSRDLIVTISNDSKDLGTQFDDIEILNGKKTIARRRIIWEAVPSVTVSPKLIFFKRSSISSKHSILIHSIDDHPFRIVKIRCPSLTVEILNVRDISEIRKKLDIQLSWKEKPDSKFKSTTVEIEIDHHVQKIVSIPIQILGVGHADQEKKP